MKSQEVLELYKIFVNSAAKVTEARARANAFFVSLNTAIIGANSFIGTDALLVLGGFINFLWFFSIESHKCLNAAKFQVIHDIEKDLKYQCFRKEYDICKKFKRVDFSKIENKIPLCFSAFFIVMLGSKYWLDIINTIALCCCRL